MAKEHATNKKRSTKEQVQLSAVEALLLEAGKVFGMNCTILLRLGITKDNTPAVQVLSVKAIHEE